MRSSWQQLWMKRSSKRRKPRRMSSARLKRPKKILQENSGRILFKFSYKGSARQGTGPQTSRRAWSEVETTETMCESRNQLNAYNFGMSQIGLILFYIDKMSAMFSSLDPTPMNQPPTPLSFNNFMTLDPVRHSNSVDMFSNDESGDFTFTSAQKNNDRANMEILQTIISSQQKNSISSSQLENATPLRTLKTGIKKALKGIQIFTSAPISNLSTKVPNTSSAKVGIQLVKRMGSGLGENFIKIQKASNGMSRNTIEAAPMPDNANQRVWSSCQITPARNKSQMKRLLQNMPMPMQTLGNFFANNLEPQEAAKSPVKPPLLQHKIFQGMKATFMEQQQPQPIVSIELQTPLPRKVSVSSNNKANTEFVRKIKSLGKPKVKKNKMRRNINPLLSPQMNSGVVSSVRKSARSTNRSPKEIQVQMVEDVLGGGSPLRKKAYSIKIDAQTKPLNPVLASHDIATLFTAKITDLGIQFFQNQYSRFIEYCDKYCVNRKLHLLDSVQQNLGIESTKAIIQLVQRAERDGNFGRVYLGKNQIGDEGAVLFANALFRIRSLACLDLSSNSIGTFGGAALLNSLEFNQSLIDLNLSSIDGFSRNTLGPAGVRPLQRILPINQILTFLNLAGNFIGDAGVSYLCNGISGGKNKGLKVLNLALNDISEDGVEKLRVALPYSSLSELNLSRNQIKNKGAFYIGEMIQKGNEIGLDTINLTECGITHQGAFQIYMGVKKSGSIRTLILDQNNLAMKHCPELSQALWCNYSLEKLSFVSCNLQDNGCIYLMDGLERNRSLLHINLSSNNLRVQSARRIAEVLASEDFKLQTLILSNNFLGDQGGYLIGKALSMNRRLTKVDLFDNFLQDESAKQLAQSLVRNTSLQKVNLGLNGCNLKYVQSVSRLANQNREQAMIKAIPRQVKEIISLSLRTDNRAHVEEKVVEAEAKKDKIQEKFVALDAKYDKYQRESWAIRQIQEEQKVENVKQLANMDGEVEEIEGKIKKVKVDTDKHSLDWMIRIKKAQKEKDLAMEEVRVARETLLVGKFKLQEEKRRMREVIDLWDKKGQDAEFQYLVMLTEVQNLRETLMKTDIEIYNELPLKPVEEIKIYDPYKDLEENRSPDFYSRLPIRYQEIPESEVTTPREIKKKGKGKSSRKKSKDAKKH